MTIKDFINKAIEGGWMPDADTPEIYYEGIRTNALLDPLAWQAVGKVEGWEDRDTEPNWQNKMHQMIDALVEGKTLEEFIETL